jgi:hypothetical protein
LMKPSLTQNLTASAKGTPLGDPPEPPGAWSAWSGPLTGAG